MRISDWSSDVCSSDLQRQVREIELGNIDVVRDFLDVRDVANLYCRIVDQAPTGETINLCSGQGHSLGYVIEALAGLAGYEISVCVNPAFIRANGIKRLIGSTSHLISTVGGFSPRTLEESLGWMYRATSH